MAPLPVIGGQEMDEGLEQMWISSAQGIHAIDSATENWKNQKLPLAKIKKIMKSEDVILQELERDKQAKHADQQESATSSAATAHEKSTKFMISGEAPVLMSKACELMIRDLSFRAWRHTERNRRRTLQKQDLHAAVGESEVYDFLIDIVPRVTTTMTVPPPPPPTHSHHSHLPSSAMGMYVGMDSVGRIVAGGLPSQQPTAATTTTGQTAVGLTDNTGMMQQFIGSAQQQRQQTANHQSHQDPIEQVTTAAAGIQSQMGQQVHQQQLQQNFTAIAGIDGAQLEYSENHPTGASSTTTQRKANGAGSTEDPDVPPVHWSNQPSP